MTFFIYFSAMGEGVIGVLGLLFLFVPWSIARWASIFAFISEFPFLTSPQIIVIVADSGSVTYATFGVPLSFLTPFLYIVLIATFIAIQNMFIGTDRDYLGRAPKGSGRRFSKR